MKRAGKGVRRLLGGLVVAAVLLAGGGCGVSFVLACAGALEVYTPLAELQKQFDPLSSSSAPPTEATTSPLPPGESSASVGLARQGYAAVSAILRVKQSNEFAYAAHVTMAQTLQLARCPKQAVRFQWLKAAVHAPGPDEAYQVALALRRGATDREDFALLRDTVHEMLATDFWSDGIRRVHAVLASWGGR